MITFGLATIVFGVSTWLPLSLAALFVLGMADVVSVVIRFSLVQLQTPDEMRGRVSAVNALFIGTSNQLGEFESGAAAALMGVVPSVVFGGCAHDCRGADLDVAVPGAAPRAQAGWIAPTSPLPLAGRVASCRRHASSMVAPGGGSLAAKGPPPLTPPRKGEGKTSSVTRYI